MSESCSNNNCEGHERTFVERKSLADVIVVKHYVTLKLGRRQSIQNVSLKNLSIFGAKVWREY